MRNATVRPTMVKKEIFTRLSILLILIGCSFLLAPRSWAQKPTTVTLKNGVRLLVQREPLAETVTTCVFFEVGQADEGSYPGINALIARGWGRDTEFRSERSILADLAGVGSVSTDFGPDWVLLRGVSGGDPSDVRKMLQTLLTNLVATPRFTPEIVLSTRGALEDAAALEKDSLIRNALATLRSRVWGISAYGQSPVGSEGRLPLISAEAVERHYALLFRPQRCLVTMTGNVLPETMAQIVRASLGAAGWQVGRVPPKPPAVTIEEIPANLPDKILPRSAPVSLTMLGYQAPGAISGANDYATLLVLDAALCGGKSSRLFTTLREGDTPIGYDIRTILEINRYRSLWAFTVIGDGDPIMVRDTLKRELAAVADNSRPLRDDEIARARAFVIAKHERERQRQPERAFALGWCELMGLSADTELDFVARVNAVPSDAVNHLATRILRTFPAVVYSQRFVVDNGTNREAVTGK